QYSEQQYEQQTMDWLIQTYMEQLQQLITHCCSAEAGGYTPSDFPLAKIDQEVLDQLTEKYPAIEQIYPLAPLQEGMLFQSMYSKNDQVGGDYIVQMVFTLKGELNQQAWEEAWHDVVQRFAVFRTAYLWEGVQQPLQLVVPNVTYAFEKQDWRIFTSVEIERNWHQLVQSDRKQGFQLDQPGLTRLHFIQIDEDHYRLLWTYHHLLLDGWSMSLVLNQVWKNYLRRADGASIEIEKEVPYERYLNWLQNQNQEAAKTYWQKKLSSKETTTWISSAPASNQARATDVKINRLSKEMTDRLQQFARQHKLTISTVLQAAWSLLLGTYSGEEYVRYGIAVAGRPPTLEHVEKIVGLFINTLPVSCRFNGEIDLLTLCRKIQQEQLEMRQHEHCSLIDIQGWSGIPRNQSLIHHLFAYENYLEMDRLEQPHLQIKEIQGLEQTEYSLCLVTAPGDELFVKWMYDRQYFHATEIEQLHQHWVSLLEQFTSSPTQTIESLTIIDPEQQEDQLTGDHLDVTDQSTKLPYRLVEQIAENHPNVIALRTQDRVYSYRQLNEAANRLAHFLRKEGVRAETKVVLYLERSCELVIGQLAVHKAGGIFIPVDPNHPIRRLHEVITDAQATWLLTQKRFDESVQSLDVQTLVLDEAEEAWGKESSENLSTDVDEDQLAYLIYTSGSTGRPKGVEITHKALFNLVHWHQERYQMDTKDRMSFIAGVGFDASIWEIWPTLASGSSLHIPEEDVRIQPELLQEWLLNEAITYSFLPTPLMEQMFSLSWGSAGSLRAFLTGGDQLRQYPKSTFPIPVVNHYGPTENTVVTTAVALTPIGEEQMTTLPPIGQAIANVKLYVLNQHQQPVPQGVKGELYIGGASLARGYHGQPEMTAERFVHHPIYGRLFRTGDQVRLAANGNLEFLGRLDQQVKIRGMRMELGEIEARLSQLPEIKECVVTVHDDQLIAYAVLSSDQSFAWQQELRKQLPTYMIPQQLISLEKIPLTPNGKIDRQALPKPEKMDSEKYVAPRTPMERKMAEIWSEVLQKDKIGLHDHFFLLGGHSLLATQAVTRMNEVFRQEIPLKYLFENPTIAQLVEQIKQDLFAKLTTS
ncbi:non-ribosomal peptide synthase domain TIGR01720/amino acid adenylation domain-containing protein, partial [Seinonella peptonophila]